MTTEFRSSFAEEIFRSKYQNRPGQSWADKARLIVNDVCAQHMGEDSQAQLTQYIADMKFLPGGRYIYYAGRAARFWNNCYLLRGEEDTREEWGEIFKRSASCLMTGGGIGTDYSVFRPDGAPLGRTGGVASGPIPMMQAVNEIGRRVMQGGSRRSAIYASLNWQHADAPMFLIAKDWHNMPIKKGYSIWQAKQDNFDYPAPLDMTNISLNYDDHFLALASRGQLPQTYVSNIRQALMTGEPGFSFNFGPKTNETLRNACTEVTSEDDSDVCNLGSVNMAAIDSYEEFCNVVRLASQFLVYGTLGAQLPYEKVYQVREKNRRLGLGLMGMHEWLLKRGCRYEVSTEMHKWLEAYAVHSEDAANLLCDELSISRPAAYRAVAPTGSIGILAGTTTGIEPLYAVAYRRRFLKGKKWHYTLHVDSTARMLVDEYGLDPDRIETSLDLAADPERRMAFQADVQDYVDMSISSTINLPAWGSDHNNEDKVTWFAETLAKYAPRLRGFTVYPDGARGGQPLEKVGYQDALSADGAVNEEATDICDLTGGGTCGG